MPSISSLHKKCIILKGSIEKCKKKRISYIPTACEITSSVSISPILHKFVESELINQFRRRTYRFWPLVSPRADQMIEAGWFYCNFQDRVLCIYCHTICYQWRRTDDPAEVHRRFAPNCSFHNGKLAETKIITEENPSTVDSVRQPRHRSMRSITCRQATFEKSIWKDDATIIEKFVRAGFFYSGAENTVTCFFCSGSLQRWGPTDQPMIEHARWFPHCQYARHLCGDLLHSRIQLEHQKHQKDKSFDPVSLNRLVNARLDLPHVQILRKKYPDSIVRRCIEDQLKLGKDDLGDTSDLVIACYLTKIQIDTLRKKPEKLLVPSMNESVNTTIAKKKPTKFFDDCVICLTEERQLALIPCGHLVACTPCAYALDVCPICRKTIESFSRIVTSCSE